jgi:eukaryotic-like serine/threonine-protein kinase
MNAAHPYHGQPGAVPLGGAGTLRDAMHRRASLGHRLGLEAAVAQIVPLCLELAEIHAQGYGFFLHPSSVTETTDGSLVLARDKATDFPADPRDRACLAPETQPEQLNDARANVYAIAAIFYELLTGASVGPGMRRPHELIPGLPDALDGVLSVALTEAQRRPDDLRAFAQSIQQLPAAARAALPAATLQGVHGLQGMSVRNSPSLSVDVSLSLIPPQAAAAPAPVHLIQPTPSPVISQGMLLNGGNAAAASPPPSSSMNGYGVAVQAAPDKGAVAQVAQAAQFAELKAQLESDPRPRYFVVKGGMDHGPFTAVELVRQIDSHSFTDEDHVVDSVDGQRAALADWPQFALFAEYAKRERQLKQRQKDIVKVAALEKKSTRSKTLVGVLIVLGLLGVGGAWYTATSGERDDSVAIAEDEATNVETDGALSIKGKKKARRRAGSAGGIPVVAGGQSCEAAMDSYNEEKSMGEQGQADLTEGQYGRVLNGGGYFSHCGVPFSMNVNICAAVQNGKAVGVTVTTQPSDPKKVACIASAVRGLSFPTHPKLDVTRTRFAAQ